MSYDEHICDNIIEPIRKALQEQLNELKELVLDNHRTVIGYCDELKENTMTKDEHSGFNVSFTEQLNELKSYYNIEKNVVNETDWSWRVQIIDRIIYTENNNKLNKEVLREYPKLIKEVLSGEIDCESFQWLEEKTDILLAKLDVGLVKHRDCCNCGFNKLNVKEPCNECHDFNKWKSIETEKKEVMNWQSKRTCLNCRLAKDFSKKLRTVFCMEINERAKSVADCDDFQSKYIEDSGGEKE